MKPSICWRNAMPVSEIWPEIRRSLSRNAVMSPVIVSMWHLNKNSQVNVQKHSQMQSLFFRFGSWNFLRTELSWKSAKTIFITFAEKKMQMLQRWGFKLPSSLVTHRATRVQKITTIIWNWNWTIWERTKYCIYVFAKPNYNVVNKFLCRLIKYE